MELQKTGALVLLIIVVPPAEASVLYDPKFCYFLDLFLLIYGVLITALYLREKCCKPKGKIQKESEYEGLRGGLSTYDELRQGDAEKGRARRGRRETEDTYTRLQKKTDDTYKEITVKKDRGRNDQVYQGLSAATKDTYDSLHMQPLPPRR
ncbi:T-cell surface glycoprotein CD3 zeta chain [Salminus brasiliensis]|uniref:T-cell surface glycoprotein CD3 zeta chain n=1 Tax=Salminus brasiliensis TaxID=930266 RepID=UPI003B82D5AD